MNLRRKTPRPCRANQHRPFLLCHARRPDKDVTYTYITTDYGVARGCDYVPRMPATNSFHFARRVAAFAGVASYMDRTVERETTNNPADAGFRPTYRISPWNFALIIQTVRWILTGSWSICRVWGTILVILLYFCGSWMNSVECNERALFARI